MNIASTKMPIDLGFVQKCDHPWLLKSRFIPSKVGGKPAWLHLKNIPAEKDLLCEYCKEPCIFLCQIYAPYEENEDAFHRTIFVFICKKSECSKPNENGNLKVFRSQLARINEFYPPEPPVEEDFCTTDIDVNQWTKTCYVCGISASNHCSKCKDINYCCRAHQIYDWKHGHKESCSGNKNIPQINNFLFPEYEIIIESDAESDESEKNEDNASDYVKEEEEMEKYEIMVQKGEAGTLHNENVETELLNMVNYKEDEIFSKFRLTIDRYPDQILRYNRGGKVLYISDKSKIGEIPKCPECNGERQFEFQIMPQLLNFLNLENALKSIDWGILAIFTCIRSCTPKNGYSMEYVWKQDIVEENRDDTSKT